MSSRSPRYRLAALLVALVVGLAAAPAGATEGTPPESEVAPLSTGLTPSFSRVWPATTQSFYPTSGLARWVQSVPGIADVRIRSTADGTSQPSLWLAPNEPGPRPLLVVLHSWSAGYTQHLSIPYAQWARTHGWAMIHPDFRGRLDGADSTGSDLAVQDVIDAIDFAQAHADIDAEQVYVVGFSGGGMMSLIMAGRHADRFAGAVSWVPIYNLVEWAADQPRARYVADISASCGGNPLGGGDAWLQCTHRSPSTHLNGARTAGIPVFIGHGSTDGIVYPDHSVRAFNQLADPEDRLTPAQSDAIGRRTLPAELRGQIGTTTYFRGGDPTPVFARQSGPVRLVLFSGGHAGVFNPGLEWMVNLRAAAPPSQVVRDAVSRLYVAYFDREPDTAGLGYWTRVYAHGRSLSSISSHFAVSPEFVGRYGDVDDEGFVRLVYANVLGRDPDGGGLAYWTGVLESGRSRGSLMVGFSQSAEFRALTGTT